MYTKLDIYDFTTKYFLIEVNYKSNFNKRK